MPPRGDVNFRGLFQDFNAPKFVVFTCLLVFTMLFALRLDGAISISWWSVFIPIWVWKLTAVSGAIVGSIVWFRRPQSHLNLEEYIQFKSMLISLSTHLLLLMFELLLVDNLQYQRHMWILVFLPLIIVSSVSFVTCIWSLRHDRLYELEFFCAINILQFIFIPLKLDRLIHWSWEVTFVPSWILLCVSLVGVLYTLIFAGVILRLPEITHDQHRASTGSLFGYSCLVIPVLVSLVMLTNKLDDVIRVSFFAAASPLYPTFLCLMTYACGSRGGNPYWFGLRKPPCQFLFGVCPSLQLFGNISYTLYSDRDTSQSPSTISTTMDNISENEFAILDLIPHKKSLTAKKDVYVVPHMTIEMPD